MSGKNFEQRPIYLRTFTLRGLNDLDEIKKGIEKKYDHYYTHHPFGSQGR